MLGCCYPVRFHRSFAPLHHSIPFHKTALTMNAVAVFARTGIRARATMGATPMRSGAYHWTNDNGKVLIALNNGDGAFRYQQEIDPTRRSGLKVLLRAHHGFTSPGYRDRKEEGHSSFSPFSFTTTTRGRKEAPILPPYPMHWGGDFNYDHHPPLKTAQLG